MCAPNSLIVSEGEYLGEMAGKICSLRQSQQLERPLLGEIDCDVTTGSPAGDWSSLHAEIAGTSSAWLTQGSLEDLAVT
jgi:hypothetical protein